MSTPTAHIGDQKYVALTTRKKSGEVVTSPVWIARLSDGSVGFTTEVQSGKAKRIRNFPEVTLQPCTARGKLLPGSSAVTATATVLVGDDTEPVRVAIAAKYGLAFKLIGLASFLRHRVFRKPAPERGAIRMELT